MRDYDAELAAVNERVWEADLEARAIRSEAFQASIPDRIRDEQAHVDQQIAAGRHLIINRHGGSGSLPLVHDVKCFSMRERVDRPEAWRLATDDPRGSWSPAAMPEFVTDVDLVTERRYRTCGNCQPLVADPAKNVRLTRPTTTVENLTRRHLGREFEDADGQYLGFLHTIKLHPEGASLDFGGFIWWGANDDTVRMLPQSAE